MDRDRTTTGSDYFQAARERLGSTPAGRPLWLTLPPLVLAVLTVTGAVGPWVHYERISTVDPQTWTMYGLRSDGVFGLLFGVIAVATLIVTVRSRDPGLAAWVAFGALALCAIIGVFDWIIFGPGELTYEPAARADVLAAAWGLKLMTVAAVAGAIWVFVLARSVDAE